MLGIPPDVLLKYQLVKRAAGAPKGGSGNKPIATKARGGGAPASGGGGGVKNILWNLLGGALAGGVSGASAFAGSFLGGKSLPEAGGDAARYITLLLSIGVPTTSALLLAYYLSRSRAKDQEEIKQLLTKELAAESARRGRMEIAQTMSPQEKAQARRKKKKTEALVEDAMGAPLQPQSEREYAAVESAERPASLTPASELLWR